MGFFSFLSDDSWTYLASISLIYSAIYDRRIQEYEKLPWFYWGSWFCLVLHVFVCFPYSSEYCGIFKEVGPPLPTFSCLDKSCVEKEMSLSPGSKPHEIEDVIDSPFCFLIPLFLFHDFLYFKKLVFIFF